MSSPSSRFRSLSLTRRVWWVAFLLVAIGLQLEGLYAPLAPGPSLFGGADKVAHAVIFGIPVLICVMVGLRPRMALLLSLVHAPVSELLQHHLLPGRAGDPWDVVADATGIALAWVIGHWLVRRASGSPDAERSERVSARW